MSELETFEGLSFVERDHLGIETLIGRSRLVPYEQLLLTPCIELVLLGRSSEPTTFLAQPYEGFLERWRDQVKMWWSGGTSTSPPRRSTFDKVKDRVTDPVRMGTLLGHRFHAGSRVEIVPPWLELWSSPYQRADDHGHHGPTTTGRSPSPCRRSLLAAVPSGGGSSLGASRHPALAAVGSASGSRGTPDIT